MDGAEAYARSVGVTDPDLRARLFTAEAKAALGVFARSGRGAQSALG
jgi:hypothetical protein